jgi:hypothetical protein
MAVALLALVVSLGGTAGAAVIITSNSQVAPHTIAGAFPPSGGNANLVAGSVGGTDLHKASIDANSLAASSVTSGKIKDGQVQTTDLAPAARGADAYGTVDEFGFLHGTKNVVTFTQPSVGVFCIQLAAGLPAGPATVSPDFADDNTVAGTNQQQAVVEVNTNATACSGAPAPEVQVQTYIRSFSGSSTTLTAQAQGFTFVVG